MKRYNGKLLELPRKGKALIITDLHGDIDDYNKYMSIWEGFDDYHNHLIITGDFIHSMRRFKDSSIEIFDLIKDNFENLKNFHVLLGNHEWAHITGKPVYRGFDDQRWDFEMKLKYYYRERWIKKLEEYKEFFMELPVAVKTNNGVFISHAGPSKEINSIEDVINITDQGYVENNRLYDLLWNRPEDCRKRELDSFLKAVGCKFSIVGHTCVDGIRRIHDKQLIVSSSYSLGKKAYVELDLKKDINDINGIIGMVKYLNKRNNLFVNH